MNLQQTINPQTQESSKIICKNEETNEAIQEEIKKDPENISDSKEFLAQKAEFLRLIRKYLCYRSEWNKNKISDFLNTLDVSSFNNILQYFEVQRDKTKSFEIKQDLAILYSEILEKRNNALNESRDRLYTTNLTVTKWILISSSVKIKLKDAHIEPLPNNLWYSIMLNYWEWKTFKFHLEYTKEKALIIKDEDNNLVKCSVELTWMDLIKENIWLWQSKTTNYKTYRIAIWNLFFEVKFND